MSNFQAALPRQLVIFRVAGTQYGLDIDAVEEILPAALVVILPGAPNGVLGLVDVRGKAIPLFDLHWKFSVATPERTLDTRFVVVRTHDGPVALRVDSVDEVVSCPANEFQSVSTPGHPAGLGYLNGVYRHGEELVLWADASRLVPSGVARAAQAAA